MSGESIDAEHAGRLGLVNRVFPDSDFGEHVQNYAARFLDKSPMALGLGKLAINRSLESGTQAGLEYAAMLQSILLRGEDYSAAMKEYQNKKKRS